MHSQCTYCASAAGGRSGQGTRRELVKVKSPAPMWCTLGPQLWPYHSTDQTLLLELTGALRHSYLVAYYIHSTYIPLYQDFCKHSISSKYQDRWEGPLLYKDKPKHSVTYVLFLSYFISKICCNDITKCWWKSSPVLNWTQLHPQLICWVFVSYVQHQLLIQVPLQPFYWH